MVYEKMYQSNDDQSTEETVETVETVESTTAEALPSADTTQPAAPAVPADNTQQIQVNVDYLRTTRVHICMPCYGGMLTEQTFMSFIKWSNVCRQLGIDWTVETMTNESLISRARNTLVAKFLSNPESTHLMWVDADIGWEPWHLLALLNHDKDVVGGLYPMKTIPVKWCVNGLPGAPDNDPNGLIEVTKTGTGFMLIKRHVFEKLKSHPTVVPFANDIGLDSSLDKDMKTYFDTAVRENRYYSEDWTFCENWRDLGGQVFVDKRILLRHVGTHTFDFATQDNLYAELHKLAKQNGKALPANDEPGVVASTINSRVEPTTASDVPQ
jgi:hypothetical protein